MLAIIRDDTWNALILHAAHGPKFEEWDYWDIPGDGTWKGLRIDPHGWR